MLRGIKYRVNLYNSMAKYSLHNISGYFKYVKLSLKHATSIALVVVGRNDDYMPDFAERLRLVLEWNTRKCISEPIFIEWNPPIDRPLLAHQLVNLFPTLKVFVVPYRLHVKVCTSKNLPLMEYHAKNVGIRRAESDWVIATNADIAFSPNTLLSLANLKNNYQLALTAERVDIAWQEWRSHQIGIHDCLSYRKIIPSSLYGTGDFLLASRHLWSKTRGYDENLLSHRIGCDVRGAAQMLYHGAKLESIGQVMHLSHPTSCTEGPLRPHHGERATMDNLPYLNNDSWGFGDCKQIQIGERIWQLD